MATPSPAASAANYRRIERALLFIDAHRRRQPPLADIARAAGLSEFHFQRLFAQWAGVSPKRFLQFLTKEHALALLRRGTDVLATSMEVGLSSPSRLHDLLVTVEALTPGEVRAGGAGVVIDYGFHPTPFGTCFLAATARGLCTLHFVHGYRSDAVSQLALLWPRAQLRERPARTRGFATHIFFPQTPPARTRGPLPLVLRGTPFQLKVWEALLRIPAGAAVCYEDIAAHIGTPRAVRAVGSAVGANPVAFVIPCHRVIRKLGDFGQYAEGPLRKQAMLGWEAAQLDSPRSRSLADPRTRRT